MRVPSAPRWYLTSPLPPSSLTTTAELLLTEERPAQVALHPLHLAEAGEQAHLLLRCEGPAIFAGLDRLPKPDALLVIGDVLDLVGDRAAVDLLEARIRIRKRLSLDVEP